MVFRKQTCAFCALYPKCLCWTSTRALTTFRTLRSISYAHFRHRAPYSSQRSEQITKKLTIIQEHSSPLWHPSDANLLYLLGAAMALTILHYAPEFHAQGSAKAVGNATKKQRYSECISWLHSKALIGALHKYTARTSLTLLPDIDLILSSIWLSIYKSAYLYNPQARMQCKVPELIKLKMLRVISTGIATPL